MVQRHKALRIDRGIGQFDFNDYYAVLGLPITADGIQVRRRYIGIAKRLHPDVYGKTPEEKERATRFLARLVNPAYNALSYEREKAEYTSLLKLLARKLIKKRQRVVPRSEEARKLLTAPSPAAYEQVVNEVAEFQYRELENILEITSILSELNLVYILTQAGYKYVPPAKPALGDDTKIQSRLTTAQRTSGGYAGTASSSTSTSRGSAYAGSNSNGSSGQNTAGNAANAANSERSAKLLLQQHLKAAESCIKQKQWSAALKELRSAQRLDEANSRAHALLGIVYMNQKLASMAKSSFLKALKLNPNETIALENINKIGKMSSKSKSKSSSSNQSSSKSNQKQANKGWSWTFWKR
ncbi:heat shock protein DnaJ domain protein [Thalassoporum mexicanum PCC 7367]|uniref:DnaJ domain-containing protein n=1 Tax=Thalassoporum mexicanum TaxID=3457544 RepID=UPI00029FD070|nr:DnaJ domain-containing protein [Pseudanabaena sp. PCC 7367]AFY68629.1 heat shock protein DnaJ domain protein [Pseudanabaena sp. PCC 7367]